jgi:hypothetical protein
MSYNDSTSPFVDAHCHLFNIVDVPLYEAILGKVQMGTVKQLLAAIAVGSGTISPSSLLKEQRNFIRFFERDIAANINWLKDQLTQAVASDTKSSDILRTYGYTRKRIVLTPLIMDFEKNLEATEIGSDLSCQLQFERLTEAISATASSQPDNVEIYPFAGFALNKLDGPDGLQRLEDFKKWWNANGLDCTTRYQGRDKPLHTKGKAIGIKLYPPLGFSPYPNDSQVKSRYLSFFRWCVENAIPITVHCQESSFSTDGSTSAVNARTHPTNWMKLFNENPELSKLRINFGHFGGSGQLCNLMKDGNARDSNNWTRIICQMLCTFPNTYADISAFGLAEPETCKSLSRILGIEGDSPVGNYDELRKKIIWGSDVPMVISSPSYLNQVNGKPSYAALLDRFLLGLLNNSGSDSVVRNGYEVFNMITRSNPTRFLFGGG